MLGAESFLEQSPMPKRREGCPREEKSRVPKIREE